MTTLSKECYTFSMGGPDYESLERTRGQGVPLVHLSLKSDRSRPICGHTSLLLRFDSHPIQADVITLRMHAGLLEVWML